MPSVVHLHPLLPLQATNIKFHDGMVPRETKEELLGQKGVVLWFTGACHGLDHQQPRVCDVHSRSMRQANSTGQPARKPNATPTAGLSGSGKSTVACTLEHALAARGRMTVLLDGDNVRHGLNKNLGFRCRLPTVAWSWCSAAATAGKMCSADACPDTLKLVCATAPPCRLQCSGPGGEHPAHR